MPCACRELVFFCQMGDGAVLGWGKGHVLRQAGKRQTGLRDWMFRANQEVTIAIPST